MAIKKRTPVDLARIEAFGAAADAPAPRSDAAPAQSTPEPTAPRATPVKRAPRKAKAASTTSAKPKPKPKVKAGEWPADLARAILIRYNTPGLAIELAEVAQLEERSLHQTALRALERGLEALRADYES